MGAMTARIALQDESLTPAPGGGYAEAYTTLATVWARPRPMFGARIIDGAQVQERITHAFDIRWRADYAAWRFVLFDGRRFAVRSIMNPDEGRAWLEVLAEELEVAA